MEVTHGARLCCDLFMSVLLDGLRLGADSDVFFATAASQRTTSAGKYSRLHGASRGWPEVRPGPPETLTGSHFGGRRHFWAKAGTLLDKGELCPFLGP